jgi:putative heme-binding domain-containing protein
MPHLGSEFVDVQSVSLVRDWIGSLGKLPHPPSLDPAKLNLTEVERALNWCSSSMELAEAVGRTSCPPEVRANVLTAATKLPAGNIRDLFEGYLPQSGDRKLGANPRPGKILSISGDPARGKELFFAQAFQCATCHKIDGKGNAVGPDLSDIGKKRTRDHILESILDPSRRVEPQFQTYLLRTISGQSVTGLLVRKDDKVVVLKDAQNKESVIPTDDIESLSPSRQSLMPDGLLRDATPQKAADILAYLVSRK